MKLKTEKNPDYENQVMGQLSVLVSLALYMPTRVAYMVGRNESTALRNIYLEILDSAPSGENFNQHAIALERQWAIEEFGKIVVIARTQGGYRNNNGDGVTNPFGDYIDPDYLRKKYDQYASGVPLPDPQQDYTPLAEKYVARLASRGPSGLFYIGLLRGEVVKMRHNLAELITSRSPPLNNYVMGIFNWIMSISLYTPAITREIISREEAVAWKNMYLEILGRVRPKKWNTQADIDLERSWFTEEIDKLIGIAQAGGRFYDEQGNIIDNPYGDFIDPDYLNKPKTAKKSVKAKSK